MKLPNFKRLLSTDFAQEYRDLVDQMSFSLNNGIESLYQALNKRLTINDNFYASERDVTISVTSDGTPTSQSFVTTDFGGKVRTVLVGKAENTTNSSVYPTGAVFVSWDNTQSGIQILNVKGLPAGYIFRLRLILFG